MLRVLVIALPFHRDDWRPAIWVLAVLSLVVGSVLAIVQTDVKRMLAYSSISHAGFILVGVEAAGHDAGERAPGDGMPSVLTYLLLYSVLTVGSFAVVTLVARSNGGDTSLDAFKGLAQRRPTIALGFTVFLLAQAGVPLTSGFVAKWGVIQAAVEEESYAIAIIAMVAAVVAALPLPAHHGQHVARAGRRIDPARGSPVLDRPRRVRGGSVHAVRRRLAQAGCSTPPTRSPRTPAEPQVTTLRQTQRGRSTTWPTNVMVSRRRSGRESGSDRPVEHAASPGCGVTDRREPTRAGVVVADRLRAGCLAVHFGHAFCHQSTNPSPRRRSSPTVSRP